MTEREKAVLELLRDNPEYTYVEIAENLNVSRKTVSERIKSLKDKGLIQREGTNLNGYWKIKD